MDSHGLTTASLTMLTAGSLIFGVRAQVRYLSEVRDREERLRADRAELEQQRAEALLAAQAEAEQRRRETDEEYRERRGDLARQESRIEHKERTLDERESDLRARESALTDRGQALDRQAAELAGREAEQAAALERISGMTQNEARAQLMRRVEDEARHDATQLVRQIEDEARRDADRRARVIVTEAIERCAVDHVTESTVSVVPLPSDEVKGRIIGREGRNIRSFEQLTGVDLVIDDTPEAVVISAFDPVRREVARLALELLVADGRIHPGRIEEVVERAQRELETRIAEAAEEAVFETGVSGLSPVLLTLLGKLRFRTSYSQNVLRHCIEVAHLAGAMAEELGANVALAKRAALLHDIGKAADPELEGPHALVGQDLARTQGEPEEVCLAIGAHHRDIEPASLEAVLVLTADAVSAARPGARRDTIESYVRRLERLEELAQGFQGVDRAYAIQAGREVRILVRPDEINDGDTRDLARSIAERIEQDLAYPGQIKVTVIREQRAVEYAR